MWAAEEPRGGATTSRAVECSGGRVLGVLSESWDTDGGHQRRAVSSREKTSSDLSDLPH